MDEVTSISAVGGRQQLTAAEMAQVAKLAARDRDVRAHEAAHLAAAGGLAVGGAQFTYEKGPDGKLYAVGGEVKIVVPRTSTPAEAIEKARQLRAAANAPADPSGQDAAVAVQASLMEARAMQELAQEKTATSSSPPQLRGLDHTA